MFLLAIICIASFDLQNKLMIFSLVLGLLMISEVIIFKLKNRYNEFLEKVIIDENEITFINKANKKRISKTIKINEIKSFKYI